jgi:DNA-binding transcriptional regulator YiaG
MMGQVRFIRSAEGEELAVLPRADYEALIAGLDDEDEDDIALYDQRKAELLSGKESFLPPEVSILILKGDSRLKAIRRWRKIKQNDLARQCGIGQGYLSDLESRRRAGSPETIAALATSLDVPLDWLA